ncbi:hypothetical protein F5X96DRAFT_623697 [Biscogniauxia mediterranea]|nr:hypothetical protein F5X96DRAFT_623697 [Biscogniauxia mediterranea]
MSLELMKMAASMPLGFLDSLPGWVEETARWLVAWLSQPQVLDVITAWAITFTVVFSLVGLMGFGLRGVGLGSLAAAFQSYMYGGFTPAGGVFATLTSMAMLGRLMPAATLAAAVAATVVAVLVWAGGSGMDGDGGGGGGGSLSG